MASCIICCLFVFLRFQTVAPLLSDRTKEKVKFLSPEEVSSGALLEFIAAENLLVEYGGTSVVPFGQAPLDVKQRNEVVHWWFACPEPFLGWGRGRGCSVLPCACAALVNNTAPCSLFELAFQAHRMLKAQPHGYDESPTRSGSTP